MSDRPHLLPSSDPGAWQENAARIAEYHAAEMEQRARDRLIARDRVVNAAINLRRFKRDGFIPVEVARNPWGGVQPGRGRITGAVLKEKRRLPGEGGAV